MDQDFPENFQINVACFYPFSQASLTESCLFWHGFHQDWSIPLAQVKQYKGHGEKLQMLCISWECTFCVSIGAPLNWPFIILPLGKGTTFYVHKTSWLNWLNFRYLANEIFPNNSCYRSPQCTLQWSKTSTLNMSYTLFFNLQIPIKPV